MTNGISDLVMNNDLGGNIVNTNGGESPLEYILQFKPDIISNGDLYFRYESDGKNWYFTKNGAQEILQLTANLASIGIMSNFLREASNPANPLVKQTYKQYFNDFLRVFAPGSSATTTKSGKVNIYASYSTSC